MHFYSIHFNGCVNSESTDVGDTISACVIDVQNFWQRHVHVPWPPLHAWSTLHVYICPCPMASTTCMAYTKCPCPMASTTCMVYTTCICPCPMASTTCMVYTICPCSIYNYHFTCLHMNCTLCYFLHTATLFLMLCHTPQAL